jgi:hypothetical protein
MRYIIQPLIRILARLALVVLVGCDTSKRPADTAIDQEPVRIAFTTLQKALKAHDAEQIWGLLDKSSQEDAEAAAKLWKMHLAAADAAEVKKKLGISPEELAKLDGKGFLKTEAFYEKEIEEIHQAQKIEDIKIDRDTAMVRYPDPGKQGDFDKVNFVRQDGQWKARLAMEKPKP